MKKSLLFFVLIIIFIFNIIWAETSYKIYAQLSPNQRIISGRMDINYINNSNKELSEIYFYLPANLMKEKNPYLNDVHVDSQYVNGFDPGYTKINDVRDSEGKKLDYSLEEGKILNQNYSLKDNYLKIKLQNNLKPGEEIKLTIFFETKFPYAYFGDMAYANEAFIWRFGWFPYELAYIDGGWDKGGREVSSNFYIELLVPKQYKVALGMDKVREEIAGEWKRIIGENESPRRSLPIAISEKYQVYKLAGNEIPEIYVYYYPGREGKARILASYAREIYEYYSKFYGATKHRRINIVEGQVSGFYGMTADGMIILGKSIFNSADLITPYMLDRLNEWILAHEIAHLWWGIEIGTDFDRENWISEGFANYLSITYFERKYGSKGGNVFPDTTDDYFLNYLRDYLLGELNLREWQVEIPYLSYLRDGWDEEIVKEYWESYANGYGDKVYNKSYLALRSLAFELGEERFDEYISKLHKEYAEKIITTEDIKDRLEKYSGKDLSRFFQDWFYSRGKVDYEIVKVDTLYKEGKYINRIYIRNNGEMVMPCEAKVVAKNGEEVKAIYNGVGEYIEIETNNPFERVVLDPDSKIPDANRINNWYPRKVITTSKRIIPLDAYVLRYDDVPSISINLETGNISYASYRIEFYDLLNFYSLFESFYQDGYRGLNFVYQRNLPKDDRYLLQLVWIDPDIFMGKFSFTKNLWGRYELGLSGNYWDKTYVLNYSVSYNELLNNKFYLGFNVIRLLDYYSKALLTQLNLKIGLLNFNFDMYSIEGEISKKFLVFPQSYLNITTKLGYVDGNLSPEEKLSLSDFKSLKDDYLGKVKFSLFADWNIPILRDYELKIFNLCILNSVDLGIFLEFGGVWDSFSSISKDALNLGLGFEFGLKFITFFDLPFNWYIGYAFPIWQGIPNSNETGRFYSYLTLGF